MRSRLATDLRALGSSALLLDRKITDRSRLTMHEITDRQMKGLFDHVCQSLHYAGACRRVGRLMRLALVLNGEWVGGIVLGSPFPNLAPRDAAFGLKCHVSDWAERGLTSPWARENVLYWNGLNMIVNQARTFVFPEFAGRGVGIEAHGMLTGRGKRLWERRYGRVIGFDTLCPHPRSKLFSENGWQLVGRTKGYRRDPSLTLSQRAATGNLEDVRDNAGLSLPPRPKKWWIWVKVLKQAP